MPYSMHLLLTMATILLSKAPAAADDSEADAAASDLTEVIEPAVQRLRDLVEDFRRRPVSPTGTLEFERQLQETLRELGRGVVQHTYNHLEPADVQALAKHTCNSRGVRTRVSTPRRRRTPGRCSARSACGASAIAPATRAAIPRSFRWRWLLAWCRERRPLWPSAPLISWAPRA